MVFGGMGFSIGVVVDRFAESRLLPYNTVSVAWEGVWLAPKGRKRTVLFLLDQLGSVALTVLQGCGGDWRCRLEPAAKYDPRFLSACSPYLPR